MGDFALVENTIFYMGISIVKLWIFCPSLHPVVMNASYSQDFAKVLNVAVSRVEG